MLPVFDAVSSKPHEDAEQQRQVRLSVCRSVFQTFFYLFISPLVVYVHPAVNKEEKTHSGAVFSVDLICDQPLNDRCGSTCLYFWMVLLQVFLL